LSSDSADAGRAVAPVVTSVKEKWHIETYEETLIFTKKPLYKVKVKKVVDQETVEAQETLRREELDVDTEGRSVVDLIVGKQVKNQKRSKVKQA